jgi:hypothetical protein
MKTTILCALLLVATVIQAQPKPVEVSIEQVNDRRSKGFFSELNLSLELPKVKSSEVTASRVVVQAATDDTGVDLRPEDTSQDLEPNSRGEMYRQSGEDPPCSVTVKLKNPARAASKVTEVRGDIELYMPGRDPNSTALITKFLPASGKPLTNAALKANGVEISFLSAAQIDAEKKKLIAAKRKEASESGWEGESLESYINDYSQSVLSLDADSMAVRLKDPNKRIQQIVYLDSAGETKNVSVRDSEGVTLLTTWGGAPQPDWKLRVSMKTPKNVVKHTFVLKDVKLP